MKKRTDYVPQLPPTLGINIEDYAMDNLCRTHHVNHLERACLESLIILLLCLPIGASKEK